MIVKTVCSSSCAFWWVRGGFSLELVFSGQYLAGLSVCTVVGLLANVEAPVRPLLKKEFPMNR
jgi:hypothetical protein